jgi:hypothetical protein
VRWLVPRGDTVSFRNSVPALHLPGLSGQPQVRVQFTDGRTSLLLDPGQKSGPLQVSRETWYYAMPVLGGMIPAGLGDMGYLAPDDSPPVVRPPTTAPVPPPAGGPPPGSPAASPRGRPATPAGGTRDPGSTSGGEQSPGAPGTRPAGSPAPGVAQGPPPPPPRGDRLAAVGRQDPRVPPAASGGGATRPVARSAWLGGGMLALLVLWAFVVRALLHERRRSTA